MRPKHQSKGIGVALTEAGLAQLRAIGARGCVVLGDPAYYRRFGFQADPRLVLPEVPPEYFQILHFTDDQPEGDVTYNSAFAA